MLKNLFSVNIFFAFLALSYLHQVQTVQAKELRGNFSRTCTNINLDRMFGVLTACCEDGRGGCKEAEIELGKYLGNQNGVLLWGKNGAFQLTCGGYSLGSGADRAKLTAQCTRGDGSISTTTKDLDEGISNNYGKLVWNGRLDYLPSPPLRNPRVPREDL